MTRVIRTSSGRSHRVTMTVDGLGLFLVIPDADKDPLGLAEIFDALARDQRHTGLRGVSPQVADIMITKAAP